MKRLTVMLVLSALVLAGCSCSPNEKAEKSSDVFVFEGYVDNVVITAPNYYNCSFVTMTMKDGRTFVALTGRDGPKLLFEKGKDHRIHTSLYCGFWRIDKIEIFAERANDNSAYFEKEGK